jgi:hypothetical protein
MRFRNPNPNANRPNDIDRIDARILELGLQTKKQINAKRQAEGRRAIAGDGTKSNPRRPAKR